MQRTSAPNIAGAPVPQHARGYWTGRLSAALWEVESFLERERAQLPPWLAVGLGLGIAAWFGLSGTRHWTAFTCLAGAVGIAGFAFGQGRLGRAFGWFGCAAAVGCLLVWLRSEQVASPRLDRPIVTTFAAKIERVEPLAAKGDIRLTLAVRKTELPPRVRVTIPADEAPAGLAVGAQAEFRARLAPPPPMALPGSHDFARDLWFRGIGGVGRALGPVRVLTPAQPSGLDSVRDRLGRHIRDRLPGSSGAIATALATGDQNALGEEDADAMRRSGLAHLLSVSGLHIAAEVGAAMLLTLKLLAFSERLALRFNLVVVAAAGGALAGVAYTLLTGAQVPTVRSCIAALLVLAGIALGRDAISLRLIAVAAIVILLFRPESLAGPSFQLSFAAVTAIVTLHSSKWARRLFQRRDEGFPRRLGRGLLAMVATGLVVEVALIPFALFHFHKAGLYGVAANLLAIPLTTFIIMPLEAGALLLDGVGLGKPLWLLAGWAIDFLLWVARSVASARGAVATVASMPAWAFALIVGGGLWLCLWSSRVRLFGAVPFVLGALGAFAAPRPDLLVTGDGRHMAIVATDGTPFLLRERSGDFIQDLLAESSGFDGEPGALPAYGEARCSRDSCIASLDRSGRSWRVLATRTGQRIDWVPFTRVCSEVDIVVSDRWLPRGCTPKWLKLDRKLLQDTGGVAIYLSPRPRVDSVADRVGHHPWAS
jgi:competence protein ComEC